MVLVVNVPRPNIGLLDLKKQIIYFDSRFYSYGQKAWREASRVHYNFGVVKGQEGQYCNKGCEIEI